MKILGLALGVFAVAAMMGTTQVEAQTAKEPKVKYVRKCKAGQVWNATATAAAGACEKKKVAKAKSKAKAKAKS